MNRSTFLAMSVGLLALAGCEWQSPPARPVRARLRRYNRSADGTREVLYINDEMAIFKDWSLIKDDVQTCRYNFGLAHEMEYLAGPSTTLDKMEQLLVGDITKAAWLHERGCLILYGYEYVDTSVLSSDEFFKLLAEQKRQYWVLGSDSKLTLMKNEEELFRLFPEIDPEEVWLRDVSDIFDLLNH